MVVVKFIERIWPNIRYIRPLAPEPLLVMQLNENSHKICYVSNIPDNFIFYRNMEGVVKKSYGAYVDELEMFIQCSHPQFSGKRCSY